MREEAGKIGKRRGKEGEEGEEAGKWEEAGKDRGREAGRRRKGREPVTSAVTGSLCKKDL